ncbi:MAG TPA: TIM-barrel domain-containing protein [Acidisarcina sp.]
MAGNSPRGLKFFIALVCVCLSAAAPCRAASSNVEKQPDGIILHLPGGLLRVQVLSDTVVHVAFAKNAGFFSRASIDVIPHAPTASQWSTSNTTQHVTVRTPKLTVRIDRVTGAVTYSDASGNPILAEAEGSRKLEPAEVQGEHTFHVQQQWKPDSDESLYGLGQMQLGIVDIKGYDIELWQHNTNVVIPFLVSSKGYGILWDNTSYSRFGDLRPFTPIPAEHLFDADGKAGGLSMHPVDGSSPARQTAELGVSFTPGRRVPGQPRRQPAKATDWEGSLEAPITGDYQIQTYSNGGIKVWFDGKLVIDHWRQQWLTSNDHVKLHLEAGHHYPIRIESDPEQQNTLQVLWKTPLPEAPTNAPTSLWSEVGDGVDYYFVYGPSIDDVIGGYRFLTGKATMIPNWAFGLWQSRQRYETAQQSLDVVDEFRKRNIPFDNIVQDWQYWKPDAWGSQAFDPARFPDPEGWIKAIHERHAHLMISVWGKFNPNTDNAKDMQAKGFLYQPALKENEKDWIGFPYTFYDAFNPAARKLFWSQVNTGIFSKGADAWWMDATEPDMTDSPPTLERNQSHMNPTAMGSGARMLNGYALMNSMGVYTGQREAAPNQRVFILTRSSFAGNQRYSAATWSGDITSTWTAMAKQIPAGLGMSISGVPYWTMDIGGYTMQQKFAAKPQKPEDQDEWRELNARWFEFGTFCPLLRVHGEIQPREMWAFGDVGTPAYDAELKSDRLRYAMMPYIYSLAGAVTQRDSTIMRPLVMDFPADKQARGIPDEYMFGPAFLVAPVTRYKDRSRDVYLPQAASPGTTNWYDFWTGKAVSAGLQTAAPAPYDQMPVFVRAGSIIPFVAPAQYVAEKPNDPITLYVYTGANGDFTLYEDQGTTFDYEHGAFSEIPMHWDESKQSFTVGARRGTFPGMLRERSFKVIVVDKGRPAVFLDAPNSLLPIKYSGSPVTIAPLETQAAGAN